MWRAVFSLTRTLPEYYSVSRRPLFRKYLTSSFTCEDAWKRRLQSPYLKKINVSDLFYEIEHQFLHYGKANALDIDLFANSVVDDIHIDEVEDVIHKLRLSTEAASLLPSTQHAFIRNMLEFGNVDELLRILDDRLNYGIFMDDYCCILLLDKCLKDKDYQSAARVAGIQMLQEDFSHPIIKYMSLFACHNYILQPVSWIPDKSESEQAIDENSNFDEDEVRVRVRYIRNDYFDDHFDLREPNLIVGKTLWMIGKETPNILGRSYCLIGYTLHEKWDVLKYYIDSLLQIKNEPVIFEECISIVNGLLAQESTAKKTDVENTSSSKPITKEEVIPLLAKLENSCLLSKENFLNASENEMKAAIEELQENTVNNQLQTYDLWEQKRAQLINEHIEKVKRDKTIAEIEAAKQNLKEQEEELFFFENEDKLDVIIQNKNKEHPRKWLGKIKKKRAVDKEYIPPDIEKKRIN